MVKTKYFKCILLALCVSSNLLAQTTKNDNSIDMAIESLDYTRPKSGIGLSGKLVFKSLNFYRDGLYLLLNNKDTIFNSDIFIRPGFVGFSGPHTSLGYSVEENSILKDIQKMAMTNSQILINNRFFQLAGRSFSYKDLTSEIKLDNFGYHCKGHPDYNSTDADGIIAGCLLDSKVSPLKKKKNKNTTLDLYYKGSDEDGDTILSGKVSQIEIKPEKLLMDIPKFSLNIGSFDITGTKLDLDCKKDPELTTFDTDNLINNCLNDISINSPIIKIEDKIEDSNFLFDSKKFIVANKKLDFESKNFKLYDKEGQTDIEGLKIDCAMDSTEDLFDIHKFINQCIKDGDIYMYRVYYEEFIKNKNSFLEYQQLIKPDLKGTAIADREETGIKKMRLKIIDHYFKFTAKVKIWPTYYNISASGTIDRGKNNEIIIDIRKTKLPLWITSKSIFLYYFKKYLVSETIQVKNDKIYITL